MPSDVGLHIISFYNVAAQGPFASPRTLCCLEYGGLQALLLSYCVPPEHLQDDGFWQLPPPHPLQAAARFCAPARLMAPVPLRRAAPVVDVAGGSGHVIVPQYDSRSVIYQELQCVRNVIPFVLNSRVTCVMRLGIGEVPILTVAEAFDHWRAQHDIIPLSACDTIRTLMFMIVPAYEPPCESIRYILLRVGDSRDLTSSIVAPFAPKPTWEGLWRYLQNAHGVVRMSTCRYELICGEFIFNEDDCIAWLPPNVMMRLRAASGFLPQPLIPLGGNGINLAWPRCCEDFMRELSPRAPLVRIRSVCPSCSRPLTHCDTKTYLLLARTCTTFSWSNDHCAMIEHVIRLSGSEFLMSTERIPLCIRPAIIQLFLSHKYRNGCDPRSFELLPGSVLGAPTWSLGVGADYEAGASSGVATDLVSALHAYIVLRRLEALEEAIGLWRNGLACQPQLWFYFPCPFAHMSETQQWSDEFRAAVTMCREATMHAPDIVQLQGLDIPDRILSDIERSSKRFDAWVRLAKSALLLPNLTTLSTEQWPSPFDLQLTKRSWEATLLHIRESLRSMQRDAGDLPTLAVASSSYTHDYIGGVDRWSGHIQLRSLESMLSDDAIIRILRYLSDLRYMQAVNSCCKRLKQISSMPETWAGCYIIGYRLANRLSTEAEEYLAATVTRSIALCCRPPNCWWTHKLAESVLYGSTYDTCSAIIGREHNQLFAAKDIQFQTCSFQIRGVQDAVDISIGISVRCVNNQVTLLDTVRMTYGENDEATEQAVWLTLHNLHEDEVCCSSATKGIQNIQWYDVSRREFRRDGVHDVQLCWSERVFHATVDGVYFAPLHLPEDAASFTNWAYAFGRAGFGRRGNHVQNIHVRSRYHTLPVCHTPPPAESGRWLSGGSNDLLP